MNAKVTIHYNTQAQDVYGDDPDKPFQYVHTTHSLSKIREREGWIRWIRPSSEC